VQNENLPAGHFFTSGDAASDEVIALGKRVRLANDRSSLEEVMDTKLLAAEHLMNPLEERIGYKFRNSLLLAEALTHSSISLERKDYPFDNQRLEFLGDAVLQLVITEELFRLFPDFTEGQLTKIRTRLVSRTALKVHAVELRLGEHLMMGKGEESSGGRERASTLGDSFEALVGGIYLDGGLASAKKFILRIASADLAAVTAEPFEINPKGKLQELLQSLAPCAPSYEILEESGPEHLKHFRCRVVWDGLTLGEGCGGSKKEAEVEAAGTALALKAWQDRP
jgi:ribonuclease-3